MTRVSLTTFETALGRMTVASTGRGVCAASLPGRSDARIRRAYPDAGRGADPAAVRKARRFLAGGSSDLDVPLDLHGTPFQLAVWDALRAIPYGETITYAELARRVGRPKAVRAVGQANGANPVPLFVPCHRVVAANGGLGGFGGGLALKRRLLDLERGQAELAG